MAKEQTMSWSQMVTTVDLPDVELDGEMRAMMAAHIKRVEERFWDTLSYKTPPAETVAPRCKCSGAIYNFTCSAWNT